LVFPVLHIFATLSNVIIERLAASPLKPLRQGVVFFPSLQRNKTTEAFMYKIIILKRYFGQQHQLLAIFGFLSQFQTYYMNEQVQNTSNEQKETWNKVAHGWRKWDEFTMNFLKPMGAAIIKALDVKTNDVTLDIASGTGEPAFSIAAIAKGGKVYATDLSEEMLVIAQAYAQERDINNVEFKVADVSSLPFSDDFFDKISCRMGFMFFPDMQLAAKEIFRVCKNGGKMAVSVWAGAEKNDWYTTMTKVLSKHIEMPRPPVNAPGMFRCAAPGLMKQLFEDAGFKNVNEETIFSTVDFGTAENYWLNRTEMSESVVQLLSTLSEEERKKIKADLLADCNGTLTDGRLIMNCSSLIISAEK
jgi:ubiquinone/menaquinone biosynthesis C-methylase UbiE